jgi:hypothetical protein
MTPRTAPRAAMTVHLFSDQVMSLLYFHRTTCLTFNYSAPSGLKDRHHCISTLSSLPVNPPSASLLVWVPALAGSRKPWVPLPTSESLSGLSIAFAPNPGRGVRRKREGAV